MRRVPRAGGGEWAWGGGGGLEPLDTWLWGLAPLGRETPF